MPRSPSSTARSRSRDREQPRNRRRDRSRDRGRDRRRPRDSSSDRNRRRDDRWREERQSPRSRSPRPLKDRSPPPRKDRYSPPPLDAPPRRSRRNDFVVDRPPDVDNPPVEKQKPNFSNTGLLAAASNTVNDVVLKYSEPADARKPPPSPAWKLFIFKDGQIVETIELSTRTCWLIGRDRAVVDIPIDHPSCSKQHAVFQFRFVTKVDEMGDRKSKVKLYVMDLESANGTTLGNVEIEGGRFVEVRDQDFIKFGLSTREYVAILDRT